MVSRAAKATPAGVLSLSKEEQSQMATAPQSKTVKSAKVATPFDAFSMSVPNVDVPAAFRDFAEKSIEQARDAYSKLKSAAEEATDMVEGTYETAREGAFAFGAKVIDAAKSNSDASFAFAKDLFGAKTFAEVVEINSTYARKQFDAVAGQMKELQELAQKVVNDATKPVTTQVQKTFKEFNAA
jgi:phasin